MLFQEDKPSKSHKDAPEPQVIAQAVMFSHMVVVFLSIMGIIDCGRLCCGALVSRVSQGLTPQITRAKMVSCQDIAFGCSCWGICTTVQYNAIFIQ